MRNRTPIYHFTHVRNLTSIVSSGRLLCKSQLADTGIKYADIAARDIQRRRSRMPVSCGIGGMLPDYVPFFFAPLSPMLYYINKNVDIYPEGQEPLVYLVAYAEDVQTHGIPFVFTDGHPIMALTNFYDDLADLNKVDWTVMKSRMWNDTVEYPDRQRRREAEFLVHHSLPLELVKGLVTMNDRMKQQVEQVLEETHYELPVIAHQAWYY